MRTTRKSAPSNAKAAREQAWARLKSRPTQYGATPAPAQDHKDLNDIAQRYDSIVKRARETVGRDVSEPDILAALRVVRTLRDKLKEDELHLIDLARLKKVTWARIADALELSGRQAAERRRLQLSQAATRFDGSEPRTQSERVEVAREERRRRTEREWAYANRERIRRTVIALAAIENLQERADRSAEAQVMTAPITYPSKPHQMTWPQALTQALAEQDRFRLAPQDQVPTSPDDDPMEEWHIERREAQIAHTMIGLLRYAASSRYVDLADHPQLLEAIRTLCDEFEHKRRRH